MHLDSMWCCLTSGELGFYVLLPELGGALGMELC